MSGKWNKTHVWREGGEWKAKLQGEVKAIAYTVRDLTTTLNAVKRMEAFKDAYGDAPADHPVKRRP